MIKIENIQYQIGKKQIISNISATFLPSQFNMILGCNGSGKSTLLKIISGDIDDYNGTVFYDDLNLSHIKKAKLACMRAVLSQLPVLSFPLRVEEVIMMGRYPHFEAVPGKKDVQICNEIMQLMNLANFRNRNYLTLSGGEKQRVQFARVLAQLWEIPNDGNRFLMLDEPLNSLDVRYQHEFLKIAQGFVKKGGVLIAIVHDINLAAQYGDQLFLLKDGQIVVAGSATQVVTAQTIETAFDIRATIIQNPINGIPHVMFQ